MVLHSEIEAYADLLIGHFRGMARSLRKLPEDKWDWTYSIPAPTPRILAVHALQWMQCDRQHICNPDAMTHRPVPEAPSTPEEICGAMEVEADIWEEMLKAMNPEDLDREGRQFGDERGQMNVRGFIAHMVQNMIYKHGQFATIFFALGLDGDGPYEAPFPNPIYKEVLGIG